MMPKNIQGLFTLDIFQRDNGASAGNLSIYMNNSFSSFLYCTTRYTMYNIQLYYYTTRHIQYYSLLRTNQNFVNILTTYLFKIYEWIYFFMTINMIKYTIFWSIAC